jgi:two-component system OmpR family response regulator
MTSTQGRPSKDKRVLVVDDELPITELLQMALNFEGYEVNIAASGREALELTKSFRPDLIVLDVMMPGLDGFQVVKRLREERDDTPILFLTARDSIEDRVEGLRLGSDDYLTKPFSLAELTARIEAVLRRTGGGPAEVSRQ